jgi:hypothetical protein
MAGLLFGHPILIAIVESAQKKTRSDVESDLETALISRLKDFLLELGSGFAL